uniref:MICOS complex subunit n=1 Tax=Neogobius melanostomus TaxID=47308 RepID=A0A8C6WWU0_9GOBI
MMRMSRPGPRTDSCPTEITLKVTEINFISNRIIIEQLKMPGDPALSAAGTEDRAAPAPLNREELSLYTVPEQNYNFIQHEPGQIEETVAAARSFVQPYFSWCRGTYNQIKPKVQRGVQLGADTYAFLRDPPKDFYPRAGVIGFTGILGLFLARGSRAKRLLYPAGLVAVSASLYYPERAAGIAKSTGDRVYAGAVQGYAALEKLINPPENKQTDSENTP